MPHTLTPNPLSPRLQVVSSRILSVDMAGRTYVWSTLSEVILNLLRRFSDSISCVAMSADEKVRGNIVPNSQNWVNGVTPPAGSLPTNLSP